jgi:cytochrome P450
VSARGSLPLYDPYDAATLHDPYPAYRRLRDEAPVYHQEERNFWVLSRFSDVFAAVTDSATFSSAQGLTFEPDEILKLGLAPTLVMMDRPEHTTYRRLISRGFTPRNVAALEPAIRTFVRERVQAMAEAGEADFIASLAGPLPSLVVATYLGVPEEDRGRFDGWSGAIVSANARGDALDGASDAVGELYRYFADLIEWRRTEPGDDMLSDLVQAEVDGEPLDLLALLGYCFVMIAGGNDTVTGLLGGAAVALTERPDQRRLLVDTPGRIPAAVDELLRLVSPVQGLSRTTTCPVTIAHVTIGAGEKVHLLYGSANRDPREWGPDADDLKVDREIPRMLAFGGGPHHCIGAAAARLQSRVALEELLAAMPEFVVDPERGQLAPGPFVRRYESLPLLATP